MNDTMMMLMYALLFIIGFAVTAFILLAIVSTQGRNIRTVAVAGLAIVTSIAGKAITQGGNILSSALDFVNAIYAEISLTLANVVESFARIVQTIGVMIRDRIQLFVFNTLLWMQEFEGYVNGIFNLVIVPTVNAVDRVFNLLVQIITDLVGTFNPTTC
jgi:hypothetical protein